MFLWNRAAAKHEVEALSRGRSAVITDRRFLTPGPKRSVEQTPQSYYFCLDKKGPLAARSFYVNLPVLAGGGGTFGVCYDRDNNEIPNSGIGIIESDGRLIVSLPWDISSYEQGPEWEHRPYFSTAAGKHFVEVGPMLDTGAFRRLLLEILLYCFNWVGLPLVRVSPFYKNKRYFSFRIDADGFSESSTEAGLRVAEKSGLRFTWFLDMGRWKNKNKWILRLLEQNQDVQLHCFRHMTYASREVNNINIRKGLKAIHKSGITPNAIVSPLGYAYPGFSEAIKEHGFALSSEFGYAVDDLPSWPCNDKNYPLQIPVHPGCSGVFSQAGFSRDEQFSHFVDAVQKGCSNDGICILYDHPMGGLETYETQYINLFDQLSDSHHEYICMSDYYRAWSGRPQNVDIVYGKGRIEVDGFHDKGFQLEQVTNGAVEPVRWENDTLPKVKLRERVDEFLCPLESIKDLVHKNGLLNMKQRNCSKSEWYLHELYLMLGTRTGYLQWRRSLSQTKWARALKWPFKA